MSDIVKPSPSLLLNNPCEPCIWSPSIRPIATSSEDSVSESENSNKKPERTKERIKTRSQTQITARELLKTVSGPQSAIASVQNQKVEEDIEEQNVFISDDEMADSSLLPNFSGCENVEVWMHSLYNYAMFKKLDEPTRAAFFKLKLTGLAKTWLEGLDEEISADPDELFKQFKERFRTTDIVKQKQIRDIFTVKQQPYESVDTYVGRISTIAQQCGLSEELVINAVSLGLKPAIAAFVMENNPTTINDVVKYARTAEITRQGTVESTEALNNQIISLGQQLTEMNNKISQLTTAATASSQVKNTTENPASNLEGTRQFQQKMKDRPFRPRFQNPPYSKPGYRQFAPREWDTNGTNQSTQYASAYNPQNPYPQYLYGSAPNGVVADNTAMNMAQRPPGPSGNARPQGQVRRCFICNKPSHIARDCWYNQTQQK